MHFLNEKDIRTRLFSNDLVVLTSVNSTNQYLIEHINKIKSGYVCIAEYQSHGRGRYGRQWLSPFGCNLYLSIYWLFKHGLITTLGLSLVIGITVVEVLQFFGVKGIGLKWPNDLYFKNRKLAGILVEFFGKIGNSVHAVIGIGINIAMKEPIIGTINQKWINLKETGLFIDRNILAAELINALRYTLIKFECNGLKAFINHWKSLDILLNNPVKLLVSGNKYINGISRGINDQGALLIEQDGVIHTLLCDEISLRAR